MRPHEEFLELCAVSTTGELTDEERRRLREHLKTCPECRRALSEFQAVANIGAPLLSSELGASHEQYESSFAPPIEFPALATGERKEESEADRAGADLGKTALLAQRNGNHGAPVNWNYVWLSLAAAVLLVAALGVYSYQVGKRHAAPTAAALLPTSDQAKLDTLEQQLSDAGHERELLTTQLAAKDRQIGELRRDMQSESSALNAAKIAQADLEESLQGALSDKQQMSQQEASANQNLAATQASLEKVQSELDSARQQRNEDQLHAASLQTRIGDLEAALTQSQQTASKQQELLSEDSDIRDLMGARDLYIAEVYDVGRDGATQKPYGRVFYTKGKSLIFYAYDLDQQPGAKVASTFQAWGQNGPDRQQALNLGIFYQDSVAKKRWVLKFDNPRALEQINAVFVTVEPNGGSDAPSGKPLLFASLKIDSNHP